MRNISSGEIGIAFFYKNKNTLFFKDLLVFLSEGDH
jgi:hypothetical protein